MAVVVSLGVIACMYYNLTGSSTFAVRVSCRCSRKEGGGTWPLA